MAILQPQPKTLDEILVGKKYKVPLYQRTFSWRIDEAEELWNDLVDNDPPYFLGILLLREDKDDNKLFEVVDGQQRLATLMLLLRAAVEILNEGSKERLRLQGHYINQEKWDENDPDFTLTLNYRDNDRFRTLLSDNHQYLPPKGTRKSSSWKNLEEVKNCFLEKLTILKNKGGTDAVIKFIKNRVLNLIMLDVQLESDSDVYLFFETLNDRGMDLSLADLVKNRVCGVSRDPYSVANKIDQISDLLGSGRMKPFLLHYCWALTDDSPPPPRKDLMDWYSKTIRVEEDEFINKLKEYADIYHELIEPRKSTPSQNKEVLTYIKVLGASRCYPLLLVGKKFLSQKEFLRLCKAIELLTVRHSTIAKRDTKNLEDVYQRVVKDIRDEADFDDIIKALKKQSSKISNELFETSFREYEPENTQIAKYILLKIEDYLTGEKLATLDWDKLTLGHIVARGLSVEGTDEFKERLGNMTLLSDPRNKAVGNKQFSSKREEYKNETRITLTQDLVKYSDFTKDSIVERQAKLAALATKVWDPNNLR